MSSDKEALQAEVDAAKELTPEQVQTLVRLLHRLDGQLGLAVYRGDGKSEEWKREASDLIILIRKALKELQE